LKTRSKATISTLLAFVLVFSLLALIDHQTMEEINIYYDDYKTVQTNNHPLEVYKNSTSSQDDKFYLQSESLQNDTFEKQSNSKLFVWLKPEGGLGNQLFEYACAYSLAKQNGIPLIIEPPPSF
jgi:hypothetical protein